MITFQQETFDNMFGETFFHLISKSREETGDFHTTMPLNPRWDVYKFLDKNDSLFIYTARIKNDMNLVGYFISIIVEHNYYKNIWVSQADAFYLHPKYRTGLTGYKFIKEIVEKLKDKVDIIFMPVNVKRDLSKILNRLGFSLVEYRFALEV